MVSPHATAGKHIAESIPCATGHLPEIIGHLITIKPQWSEIKEDSSMAEQVDIVVHLIRPKG